MYKINANKLFNKYIYFLLNISSFLWLFIPLSLLLILFFLSFHGDWDGLNRLIGLAQSWFYCIYCFRSSWSNQSYSHFCSRTGNWYFVGKKTRHDFSPRILAHYWKKNKNQNVSSLTWITTVVESQWFISVIFLLEGLLGELKCSSGSPSVLDFVLFGGLHAVLVCFTLLPTALILHMVKVINATKLIVHY